MTNENSQAQTYRTLEHVIPKASKGKNINTLPNLRAACRECNQSRSKWSTYVGLSQTVGQQIQQIKTLEEKQDHLKKALSGRCLWCNFKARFKRRKESE